ncbi:hypothetical protein ACOSQ4_022350 [Xanthoceras sorbifolium]
MISRNKRKVFGLIKDKQESLASSFNGALKVWKHLWKLNDPNKIKVFAWRACKEILPTNLNLSKKGIPVSHLCSFCGLALESSDHALWGCSRLKSKRKKKSCYHYCSI